MRQNGKEPWFRDGLRFECTRCGGCCGGAPGYVWVTDEEIAALARRLGLADADFRRRYVRQTAEGVLSLTETHDYDCVFYDKARGCTVYEDRPRQCRTWPFWGKVVASPTTWEIEAEDCPGMNQGRLWDADKIATLADDDGIPDDH